MANTVQVLGIQKVIAALRKEGVKKAKTTEGYTVGFTQRYALVVHETNRKYRVGAWKYLEIPTRQLSNSGELAAVVRQTVKSTGSITIGLKFAALRIQREATDRSNNFVPVASGALRGSVYVGKGNAEKEAVAAFARSERIRLKGKKKKK